MLIRAAILASLAVAWPQEGLFTTEERRALVAYWAAADRYEVGDPPEVAVHGPWQVRQTPQGSSWLWAYNRARGLGKGQARAPAHPDEQAWEAWIEGRIALDRWRASQDAQHRNGWSPRIDSTYGSDAPPDPGPMPASLRALAGDAPPFAAAVRPARHRIRFHDMVLEYTDQVPMRHRHAYFRFPNGVQSFGASTRAMPTEELRSLCAEAGIEGPDQRIMAAVSMLEGGFDSVNTYDTGFVSVGLIQFASLSAGGGSLGQVLARMKKDAPESYQEHFRRFGIDVAPDGRLAAIDLSSGAEALGPAANQRIIEDKRLIAVFQRAGRLSRDFRIAQLKVARERYHPGADRFSVACGQMVIEGRISDIVKSEAGIATLMDRKVNTGSLDPLPAVLSRLARVYEVASIGDLRLLERELVSAMRFRHDFLADTKLTQPAETTVPKRPKPLGSRSGARGGRGGGSSGGG